MTFYRAEEIETLTIPVETSIKLETPRKAVVPPDLMLMPFIKVFDGIVVENQFALDEDGVHGCIYQLKAQFPCEGEISMGFRDMQTNEEKHRKNIHLKAIS